MDQAAGSRRREWNRQKERWSGGCCRAPPPPLRPPRKPESVGHARLAPQAVRSRKRIVQRRSLESVLTEAKELAHAFTIDPAMMQRTSNFKYTGLHHCCSRCTPVSKMKSTGDKPAGICSLIDLLRVDQQKFSRLPYRLAPYLSFVAQQPMACQRDYRKNTLSSARVQQAIAECAHMVEQNDSSKGWEQARREQERRAVEIISAMSSVVYRPLVRLVAWLFFWAFGRMFGRLDIQETHIAMLLQTQQRGVPVVFLPSHKSHMDYLIMTFALLSMGVKLPRVAAGDNLRLPFVSWLVTHLGGFFIKRKLDSSNGKDILYRKCLHEYMEQLLGSGESLEFFLEGSRSRSGKPCCPKAGLLSVIVDAVREGVVEDAVLVPINISYDRIVEKGFIKTELMGGVKRPETLREAVKGVWSFLTRRVGAVRIDISQPFSLQEFLSTAVVSKGSLLEQSQVSRRGSMASLTQCSSHRRLVTALSYHIMYDITLCSSLTPTSMVAFLLLNRHREAGATVDELVNGYLELEKLAELHGRVISSHLPAGEAVNYALHHLLTLVTIDNLAYKRPLNGVVANSNQRVRPVLTLPVVFDLYHLSNQTATLVASHAIVACSLLSLAKDRAGKNIDQEKVIESATFLAKLMAREYFFTSPCEELSLTLLDVLDDFVNCDILKRVGSHSHHGNRKPSYLDFDDEDDDEWEEYVPVIEYKLSEEGVAHLSLCATVLEPLVEGYWLTATELLLLFPMPPGQHLTELDLVAQIQLVAKARAEKGHLSRVESCSSDTIRNAVKILQDMEVLIPVQSSGDNKSLKVASSNHLVDVINRLTALRTS